MISQTPGITLRFPEATISVGEMVVRSIGSTIAAAAGEASRSRAMAMAGSSASPITAVRNAFVSGRNRSGVSSPATRSSSGAALTSALSPMLGIEAWPLFPCTRMRNGELAFSEVAQR